MGRGRLDTLGGVGLNRVSPSSPAPEPSTSSLSCEVVVVVDGALLVDGAFAVDKIDATELSSGSSAAGGTLVDVIISGDADGDGETSPAIGVVDAMELTELSCGSSAAGGAVVDPVVSVDNGAAVVVAGVFVATI